MHISRHCQTQTKRYALPGNASHNRLMGTINIPLAIQEGDEGHHSKVCILFHRTTLMTLLEAAQNCHGEGCQRAYQLKSRTSRRLQHINPPFLVQHCYWSDRFMDTLASLPSHACRSIACLGTFVCSLLVPTLYVHCLVLATRARVLAALLSVCIDSKRCVCTCNERNRK